MGPHLPGFVTMVTTVCPAWEQLVDPNCDVVMGVKCVCVTREIKHRGNTPCGIENLFISLSIRHIICLNTPESQDKKRKHSSIDPCIDCQLQMSIYLPIPPWLTFCGGGSVDTPDSIPSVSTTLTLKCKELVQTSLTVVWLAQAELCVCPI